MHHIQGFLFDLAELLELGGLLLLPITNERLMLSASFGI